VTKKTRVSAEDYEKLGRAIESTLVNDYIDLLGNTRRQVWSAFVRGIFTGFGGVIGATLMVTALLYILSQFGAIPIIGHYFQDLGRSINPH
jgi:hypothetical protein